METIHIIKNNGTKELLNTDKIHLHLSEACEGLNVDSMEIIKGARLKFYDGMKSASIQDSLIQSAQDLISEEYPDYEIASGRLLNQKIRKEVYQQYNPLPFKDCVKSRISKGYYTTDLNTYTDEELELLGSKIKYELDEKMSYSSLHQMYSKYTLKDSKGKAIETTQEIFMLIPMAIFHKTKDLKLIIDGYNLLSQRKIALPTPIMNGARTNYKKFISCNLINAGDSSVSLAKTAEAIMRCTANKSGLGINLSFIRGLGASIGKPERVKHTGILPLIKAYEAASASLTQISRGGATTLTLPFYHYEVELFSQLSDSKGTVETRARHTDQSIILNKWFLKKALAKEDIYLFHINEVPDLYDALGYEDTFNELYEKYAKKVPARHKKKVNAFNLLELFLYERMISGRLYFVFADNSYKSSYKYNLYMANLCQEVLQIVTPLDRFNHLSQKHNDIVPEIGVCILGNVNMGYTKPDELPKCANFLVRFLDTMIEESDFGMQEIAYAANNRRALGIGISNLFGYLAKSKLFYNTIEAREAVSDFMESWSFNLHKTSIQLAKELGPCNLFKDTIYSDAKFPHERFENPEFKPKLDWESLRKELKEYGIRNSSLMAVPPAGSSAEVSNSTNGVEPPRELVTHKTDKSYTFKKLVPYYKQYKNYYTTAWSQDFDNLEYLKLISCIQHYTDQAISLNLYTNTLIEGKDKVKLEELIELLVESFNLGIKTWYYQNFRTQEDEETQQGCESGGCSV